MKVDGKLGAGQPAAVIEETRRHENAGYDGLWASESAHGPFLPLVLAAEHIERRFSMPWSHPAPRMREFIMALRAIWSAWNDGTKLRFRGEFYSHTLMTPFFAPPPAPGGAPKVFLAAVGEVMTAVAGEVADGLLVHAFSTERYLREVTLPALGRGLARAGRSRTEAEVSCLLLIATGRTEEEMARAVAPWPDSSTTTC
jgi:probable F420-dependent oxidoreductase